jgi:signal transduction histidine kinase
MEKPAAVIETSLQEDLAAVARIEVVPAILDVVCRVTGMGFAAIARVTDRRWIACSVKDDIQFGLAPGSELKVGTTICNEIRQHGKVVAIDNVAEDDAYRNHASPVLYGFSSYVSMPIFLRNGAFFGTLCAIDARPAVVNTPAVLGILKAFAELIAFQLQAQQRLDVAEADLLTERTASELREQFIAVLGHDLRNPVAAILAGTRVLQKLPVQDAALPVVAMMHRSVKRMTGLIDAVLDFARTQLGSGLGLERQAVGSLEPVLQHVADELQAASPDRVIELYTDLKEPVRCDPRRIGQLASNLIANALTHGAIGSPVRISAVTNRGVMELWVANGGKPIQPALLGKLFMPFVRASVGSNQQGLGLGLFIAQEIARAHEGTLVVTSNQQETRFTFRMPCIESHVRVA